MYLVMELVKGEDLGQILRRDGPIGWTRARNILIQVCESLAEAHEAGIVHRDLKPENLLISRSRDGRDFVKVLDFGLAKLRDSEEMTQVTARGSLVGTPYYMSPEQIRAEDLDGRSDIYSLGALLYRMVTGEHPFAASTPLAVLTQHLTDPLILPSKRRPDLQVDVAVDIIVRNAMAKDRNERYGSADELRKALEHAPSLSQSQPRGDADALVGKRRHSDRIDPSGSGPELQLKREDIDQYERGLKRRRWVGLMLLPLAALGAAGAFVYLRHDREQPRDIEQEPNNTPAQANLVGNDHVVRGHIGKCLSPEESDRDFYRFKIDSAPYVLHVDLTGIPKMDLKMEVFDPTGKKIAEEDDLGPGESEDLPDVRLDSVGEYFIGVREVWVAGKPATENETDWYTLNARFQPLQASQEAEPNDTPETAIELPLGTPMRGFAGKANDIDYYKPRAEGGGVLSGSLSAIDGVDLKLIVGGKVYDSSGPGGPEAFEGVAWPKGAPPPLIVVERKDGKPDATGRWHGLVGLDAPYSLNVRLTAGH
jgi:serine/threonine-protein kinase